MILTTLLVLTAIYVQIVDAKRQEILTARSISTFLKDIEDFLFDVLEGLSTLLLPNFKTKSNKWGIGGIMKYTAKKVKSGITVLKDTISFFSMARSLVDEVSPILPKVSALTFISSLLQHLVPDLMAENGSQNLRIGTDYMVY